MVNKNSTGDNVNYIAIDGDDIGNLITACYLDNKEQELKKISRDLQGITSKISQFLLDSEFEIMFCAADGVTARTNRAFDYQELLVSIRKLTISNISFSIGVGSSLREAYIALLAAKSNGKNRLYSFNDHLSK